MRNSIAIAALLLLVSAGANAATARAVWTAPTAFADAAKTPIAAGTTLQYRIYEVDGTTPILVVQSSAVSPAANFTIPDTCFVRGYQVTAAIPGGPEGARSNASVLMSGCAPAAPTNLIVSKP